MIMEDKMKEIAKDKKYKTSVKIIEKMLNERGFGLDYEIGKEISMKLVVWEVMMGKKMLKEILEDYIRRII